MLLLLLVLVMVELVLAVVVVAIARLTTTRSARMETTGWSAFHVRFHRHAALALAPPRPLCRIRSTFSKDRKRGGGRSIH